MKLSIPEHQTPAQYLANIDPVELADKASEQGYSNPHQKAETIIERQTIERAAELDAMLERSQKLAETALMLLPDGTIVRKDELIND